jgi:hypothetical protein
VIHKHTTFYNLLDACKAPGCPLCSLVNAAVRDYFGATLYEYVNDPNTRAAVVASAGYCEYHAGQLLCSGDALGSALLYQSVLESIASSLSGFLRTSALARCPACSERLRKLEHYGSALLEAIREPEIRAALESGGPVCLPHLRWLAQCTRDREVTRYLETYAREVIVSLARQVETFVAAQNAAGQADEQRPFSQESWRRAIEFISGKL